MAAATSSRYVALGFLAVVLLLSRNGHALGYGSTTLRGFTQLSERGCDEIYVVGEGETLHTISDKCGDPFIIERNPHIQDPDDVFPGLVIKIIPYLVK